MDGEPIRRQASAAISKPIPSLTLALLLLLAARPAAPQQRQPSSFAAHRAAAQALLRQGRVAEAIPRLEQARASNPADYANNWDLALAYRQTSRLNAARDLLRALIARSDQGELRNLLAETEAAAGNPDEAARQYEEAAHREPSEKNIGDWAGHLMKHGAFEAALAVYTSGAAMHPRSVPLAVGKGAAQYAMGNYDEAVRLLCAASDLDPRDLRPLEFLGKSIGTSPAHEAALSRRLGALAERHPSHARARLYHALSLGADPTSQEKELRAALALDSRLPEAHQQLAAIAEQQGRLQEAAAAVVRLLALQPRNAQAHYRASRIYRKLGNAELAARHLAEYRRLLPASTPK